MCFGMVPGYVFERGLDSLIFIVLFSHIETLPI